MQLITKTLTRTHERAVQGHGKEVLDILHGRMWTRPIDHQAKTLKGSRERAVRGHGKKLADRRRGRKLTRAMENGQNHVRGTRRVDGPLHGAVNGLYVDTGKNWPTAVVDGS